MDFLKRRIGIPVWGVILAALALPALGAAAGTGGSSEDQVTSTTTSSTFTATTPARFRTTTTTAPVTTTSTAPTTTTTTQPTPEEQKAAVVLAFESIRTELAHSLESDLGPSTVESVDRLEMNPALDAIVLDVTSAYSTSEYVIDAAWEITRSMVPLWEQSKVRTPNYSPAFHLRVNSAQYRCSGDFMIQLADVRASKDDWLRACR